MIYPPQVFCFNAGLRGVCFHIKPGMEEQFSAKAIYGKSFTRFSKVFKGYNFLGPKFGFTCFLEMDGVKTLIFFQRMTFVDFKKLSFVCFMQPFH